MSLRPRDWLTGSLLFVIVALATIYILAFVVLAGARVAYPYEVDNLEGNMLAMSLRVLHGAPLYAAPSLDYTAFGYPPLYFHVAAAVMRVTGPGYAALRLVSVAATLATSATIYLVLRRRGVRPGLGVIAVAVFLGGYARTHYVGDAGRVDALAVALALGALAIVFAATTWRGTALAGCLGGLAILTKQPMAILIAGAAVFQLVRGPRGLWLVFLATTGATAILVLAWMGVLFDPWTKFYCFDLPASQRQRMWDLAVLGPAFLVTTLPIALGAPMIHARSLRAWRADPWLIATLGFLPMALLARGKEGGSANVFLPVVALAAILLGDYLEQICDRLPRASLALIAAQLAVLWWSPLAIWPTRADIVRGDHLIEQIAAIPGDVYVPMFPAYAAMAGKPWHVHYVALCDLERIEPRLRDQLAGELAAHRFAAVLTAVQPAHDELNGCDLPGLADHYQPSRAPDVPVQPPDLAALFGAPQLFDYVHGDKLGGVFR